MFFSVLCLLCLCARVYMCFVVTCWERADLLALVCFSIGILGQVWYLIVLILDLCTFTYLYQRLMCPCTLSNSMIGLSVSLSTFSNFYFYETAQPIKSKCVAVYCIRARKVVKVVLVT